MEFEKFAENVSKSETNRNIEVYIYEKGLLNEKQEGLTKDLKKRNETLEALDEHGCVIVFLEGKKQSIKKV